MKKMAVFRRLTILIVSLSALFILWLVYMNLQLFASFSPYVPVFEKDLTPEQKNGLRELVYSEDIKEELGEWEKYNIHTLNADVIQVEGKTFSFKDFSDVVEIAYPYIIVASGPWDWISGFRYLLHASNIIPMYTDFTIINIESLEITKTFRIHGEVHYATISEHYLFMRFVNDTYGKTPIEKWLRLFEQTLAVV